MYQYDAGSVADANRSTITSSADGFHPGHGVAPQNAEERVPCERLAVRERESQRAGRLVRRRPYRTRRLRRLAPTQRGRAHAISLAKYRVESPETLKAVRRRLA
jgi:hypothetical protein